jgi:hypothetical protein
MYVSAYAGLFLLFLQTQQETAMKLSSSRVERTLDQFQAQALPENHPALPELNRVFGDHTFFLDESGLHIVEPVAPTDAGMEAGKVVKVASWADASRTQLATHMPEPSDVFVELGPEGFDTH